MNKHGPSLLASLMLNDVTLCQNKEVVFIEQSPSCTSLTFFYRCVGLQYLWNTLHPLVLDVMKEEHKKRRKIEIKIKYKDGSKINEGIDMATDSELGIVETQTKLLASRIVSFVIKSRDAVPKQIKAFLYRIRTGLTQSSPTTNIGSSLNNLFFGKFILSSLCSNYFYLFDGMSEYARSEFMKASKLIRGAISGKSTDFEINRFAEENYDEMCTFLFDLCEDGANISDDVDIIIPNDKSQYEKILSYAIDQANFSTGSFSSNSSLYGSQFN